jgi:hypothetical protein
MVLDIEHFAGSGMAAVQGRVVPMVVGARVVDGHGEGNVGVNPILRPVSVSSEDITS